MQEELSTVTNTKQLVNNGQQRPNTKRGSKMVQRLHQITNNYTSAGINNAANQKNLPERVKNAPTAVNNLGPTNQLTNEDGSLLKQKKATIKKKQSIIGLESVSNSGGTTTPSGQQMIPGKGGFQSHPTSALAFHHVVHHEKNGSDEQLYYSKNAIGPSVGLIGSPKQNANLGDSNIDIMVLNSGRDSSRRQSNLPGIKVPTNRQQPAIPTAAPPSQQYKMNDQVMTIIKQYTKQNSLMDLQQQNTVSSRDNNNRFLVRNLTYEEMPAPHILSPQQPMIPYRPGDTFHGGYFQAAQQPPSRNKVASRGPKTLVNRTQGEDITPTHFAQHKTPKYNFSNSPERPTAGSNFGQFTKLREIQSTVQLIQTAATFQQQPPASLMMLRPPSEVFLMEQQKSQSSFGGSDSDSLQRVFNTTGVKSSGQMDLKSMKQSEFGTKRSRVLKPPVLPQGIVAPNNLVNQQQAENNKRGGVAISNSKMNPASQYVTSPDEKTRQQYNQKIAFIKSRNQMQQPNTVRQEVVQISGGSISSSNLSLHKAFSTNDPKSPLKGGRRNNLQINQDTLGSQASSGIPSMMMKAGGTNVMRSSSSHELDFGSNDGSSHQTKTNANRPQTIIKVRRTNDAQNAVKLATLRQLSQESGQRDRQSLGSTDQNKKEMMVPVIDTLDEEEEDSVEQPVSRQKRPFQTFKGRDQQLTIKTKWHPSDNAPIVPVLSRNSPLAQDIHHQEIRSVAPEKVESSFATSQINPNMTATLVVGQRNMKLPPPRSEVGATLQEDQNSIEVATHGSIENNLKFLNKKKIVYLTKPSTSSDSQVNFNPKTLPSQRQPQIEDQRQSNHRPSQAAKFVTNHSNSRNSSTPLIVQNEQQSSSNSSKIDRILAKIDKNRSDSIKNQIGIIIKKTQSSGSNVVTALGNESNRRESLSLNPQQRLNVLNKRAPTTEQLLTEESPVARAQAFYTTGNSASNNPQQPKPSAEALQKKKEQQQFEIQQKKILKIVTTANANTLMPTLSNKNLVGAVSKKKQIKIKGSLEKTGPKQISLKRDTRSQDVVGTLIERQGIYLPTDVNSPNEFSPGSKNQQEIIKKQKKKVFMRVQSHEEQIEDIKIIDSQPDEQQQVLQKPMKKSILHSMQPHEIPHHQVKKPNMSLAQHPQGFDSATSDNQMQSTEMSSNPFYQHNAQLLQLNQVPGGTPFDQSSLCITTSASATGMFQQTNAIGAKASNHMTIQDGPTFGSPPNLAQKGVKMVKPSAINQSGGLPRTSSKENPLECSLKSSVYLKFSSRYANDHNNQIKEEANEEKDSSSNSNSHQQPPVPKTQTLVVSSTTPVITNPNTNVNSSMLNEELHIEPIDSDDKLFKEVINVSSRVGMESRHGGRRTKQQTVVTTVVEQSGSEMSGSQVSKVVLSQQQVMGEQQIQRYSNQEEEQQVMSGSTSEFAVPFRQRRLLAHHQQKQNDGVDILEDEVELLEAAVKQHMHPSEEGEEEEDEEDEEAIEIKQHHVHKAKDNNGSDLNLLAKQRSSVDKKKHWLLDSDRFDFFVLQNNKTKEGGETPLPVASLTDSQPAFNEDTVIFEKENSSVVGTPPRIAQKMKNQQTHSDDEGAPSENDMVVNMSNTSSQIVVKHQKDNKPQKKMGAAGPPNSTVCQQTQQMPQKYKKNQEDSSSLIMTESVVRAGGAPEIYTYTQESYDEAREARQNGFVSNLLQPLENLQREKNPKGITDEVIETLSKKLSIDQKDSSVPTNPHWVMQKQVRMLPLLDHYLRPTYYDVIYLQPQLDINSRRSKQAKSGTSSGVHFASKLATSSQQKNELGPRLETQFNFDVLSIGGNGGRRVAK